MPQIPTIQEYRLTRSGGVSAFRPTGAQLDLNTAVIVRHGFVGIAEGGDTGVWQSSFLGSSRLVFSNYSPEPPSQEGPGIGINSLSEYPSAAERILHPELGSIWYVDLSKPPVWLNTSSGILYTVTNFSVVYTGVGGEIGDTTQGYLLRLADGTRYVGPGASV